MSGEGFTLEGFTMRGVEIIFPINPYLVLSLWAKNYFPEKQEWYNKFINLTARESRQYNIYNYWHSTAEIYSLMDNFDLIEQGKASNDNKEMFTKRSSITVSRL